MGPWSWVLSLDSWPYTQIIDKPEKLYPTTNTLSLLCRHVSEEKKRFIATAEARVAPRDGGVRRLDGLPAEPENRQV